MIKAKSGIEWCDYTWNPFKGCSRVSEGCDNCYAETIALEFQQEYQNGDTRLKAYADGFTPTFLPKRIGDPGDIQEPSLIFVNSMSDLYHPAFTLTQIKTVFTVMNRAAPYHIYQILTKRTARLLSLDSCLPWKPHIWQGATVENADYTVRIDHLRKCHAHIKFLSLEPLLGPLDNLDLTGIDWVIVGGETGHNTRPMLEEWALSIRDQCAASGVAFFFKQWGDAIGRNDRLLQGRMYEEFPYKAAEHPAIKTWMKLRHGA